MMWYLCSREKSICLVGHPGSFRPTRQVLARALKVSAPMTLEHAVICGAQIAVTVIVAPLGVMAIAANAFAVTAESICYMPGYGIGDAATTLVGQSYGAKRLDVARRFGYITVGLGMVTMTLMGVVMYVCAPWVMELMTPVGEIQSLGVEALRIEAFCRTDVCCCNRELRSDDRCRRHYHSGFNELRKHLACTSADCRVACTGYGTCRSMACDVC